ncbi:hypothetical protein [Altibacter sp. HG106]|uniref:hypothetical protein n=1 Tax=Altibacter sp. HG106 TaxID=3023937 RepID=UPI00235050F6|nr:hypothetical protein [Altibacter sp. HG106]MDC7995906.1 hypothetical protein [Altibacter sp. HG106]
MLRAFSIGVVLFFILSCGSDDSVTSEASDDISASDDTGDSYTDSIDFDITLLAENETEEFLLQQIQGGAMFSEVMNVSQSSGAKGGIYHYNRTDNRLSFSVLNFFEPTVLQFDLASRDFTEYQGFFNIPTEGSRYAFGSGQKIITFFNDPTVDEKYLFEVYDIPSGMSSGSIELAPWQFVNPFNREYNFMKNNYMALFLDDGSSGVNKRIINLNDPENIHTIELPEASGSEAILQDRYYLFQGDSYLVYDLTEGSWEAPVSGGDPIEGHRIRHNAYQVGAEMAYLEAALPPTFYRYSPTIYNFDTKSKRKFRPDALTEALEAGYGHSATRINTQYLSLEKEVIIYAYEYRLFDDSGDTYEDRYAVAFMNYNDEIIARLDVPNEVLDIFITR